MSFKTSSALCESLDKSDSFSTLVKTHIYIVVLYNKLVAECII